MAVGHPKKNHRRLLLLGSSVLMAFSLFLALLHQEKADIQALSVIKQHPRAKPVLLNQNTQIRTKKVNSDNSLYVIVMDTSYKPEDYHCISKTSWMDTLKSYDFVAGLDIFSPTGWRNEKCDLDSIGIHIPSNLTSPDISAYFLHKTLQMVEQQVNASSFLLISDATYIDTRKAEEFLEYFIERSPYSASGVCIEQRFFFQILHLGAGILLKRSMLESALAQDYVWNLSEKTGITSLDAMGHALDNAGMRASHHTSPAFLGNEWKDEQDWVRLTKGVYNDLGKCEVPKEILEYPPGKSGVCIKQPSAMSKVIFWAGFNESNKLWFTQNAKSMLEAVPETLGYYWNRLHPALCNLSLV